MNNLLALVLAVYEVLVELRDPAKPVEMTPELRGVLAELRGILRGDAPHPFETDEAALQWVRGVVQWDFVCLITDSVIGRRGFEVGVPFWQRFVEVAYAAYDRVAKPKPDAREHARVMIEIGQSQRSFQILRGQPFEDLVTKTLEDFARASVDVGEFV